MKTHIIKFLFLTTGTYQSEIFGSEGLKAVRCGWTPSLPIPSWMFGVDIVPVDQDFLCFPISSAYQSSLLPSLRGGIHLDQLAIDSLETARLPDIQRLIQLDLSSGR